MKKKDTVVKRVSIGFTEREWDQVKQAIELGFVYPKPVDWEHSEHWFRPGELNLWLKNMMLAVCAGVIREGCSYAPLACDIRHETPVEKAERIGDSMPTNVIKLPRTPRWKLGEN